MVNIVYNKELFFKLNNLLIRILTSLFLKIRFFFPKEPLRKESLRIGVYFYLLDNVINEPKGNISIPFFEIK